MIEMIGQYCLGFWVLTVDSCVDEVTALEFWGVLLDMVSVLI